MALAKQDVYVVLSGYFNPTARKVLHQQSSDVYLLYSEYRIWGGLGLTEKLSDKQNNYILRKSTSWMGLD
ncbi:MAG: hypothetical protein MZV64_05600 [Ignavibacteriales bacterium]|nr:hypothetical protein [Ignavibacteriales bacterium]